MGNSFCRRDQGGTERWWLEILGKGSKVRIVPATNELMVELGRYLRELSYPPMPVPGESTPLLLPIGGNPRALIAPYSHATYVPFSLRAAFITSLVQSSASFGATDSASLSVSFVIQPFGKWNHVAIDQVSAHSPYAFRIFLTTGKG